MSRNFKPIKPLKDRKVSAVSLYVPPEVKKFWIDCYDQSKKNSETKLSVSEFLSDKINIALKVCKESDNGFITVRLSNADLEEWDRVRHDGSPDIDNPITWDEFIIEKVNAGLRLIDDIQNGESANAEDYERRIQALQEEAEQYRERIAELVQQVRIEKSARGKSLMRDAVIKALVQSDEPLTFIELATLISNEEIVYGELLKLLDDDVVTVESRNNLDFYSLNG